MSTLAASIINLFNSFPEQDKESFILEFEKLKKPVAKAIPKTKHELMLEEANEIFQNLPFEKHTKRHPSAR